MGLLNVTKWDTLFKEFLLEKEFENTEYWTYPDKELDSVLVKFCCLCYQIHKKDILVETSLIF